MQENVAKVFTVSITDPDRPGEVITQTYLIAPQDYEAAKSVILHATYTDEGGITVSKDFVIEVVDVDESSSVTNPAPVDPPPVFDPPPVDTPPAPIDPVDHVDPAVVGQPVRLCRGYRIPFPALLNPRHRNHHACIG
jgi:hypothetical protein